VHSIGEALNHPQTLARGMVVRQQHRRADPTLGLPIQLSETPAQYHRPSPRLGEHARVAGGMRLWRGGDRCDAAPAWPKRLPGVGRGEA
jgi:crotonobetainyl-CoA:carnitine CoA-transferase CaiB-like acyl-CoA transferase